jgi:hypothetical protein
MANRIIATKHLLCDRPVDHDPDGRRRAIAIVDEPAAYQRYP